jgi:hypothetical protein
MPTPYLVEAKGNQITCVNNNDKLSRINKNINSCEMDEC